MILILLGGVVGGIALMFEAVSLYRKQLEIDQRFSDSGAFQGKGVRSEDYFKRSWYRLVALDLNALVKLTPSMTRIVLNASLLLSVLIGAACGLWVERSYFQTGNSSLPYNQLSYVIPILIGLGAMLLPFLVLRALIQRRRAKLSHQFLSYVEAFERKYLQKFDLYPTLLELTDVLPSGVFKNMTFRVAQAMQRKQEEKLRFELEVFEHQVGSIFARAFFIMIREAYGLVNNASGRRETKRISVGLRSQIEQMHGFLRVTTEDKPKKKEIVQVGFFTFPLLYGAHYFGVKMMGDEAARRFMFDSPLGSTLFVASVIFGFLAIIVNLVITRRKFDL
ncbi:hypothetical protein [Cohnella sp. AR92]|uniref:hypothetical protein n=1 Tax=Cohnella sp. AR92 TaxID=648716 RepID=UPI000F8DF2C5|nr:hypothetical protein [Cohnella sp. AR92]RUS44944.1 hypothetical protein ELR57_22065 [Cohnella sp. AR92]